MRPLVLPKRIAVLLLSLLVAAVGLPAAAQPHHKKIAREEVEDMDQQWRTALLSDDAVAMDKLLSDDYLGITGTGEVVTKLQELDRMRSRNLAITQLDVSDAKIKLIGQIAIVTSTVQIDGTVAGEPLHGNYRSIRVYQRKPDGAWKLTSFEATRVRQPRRAHGGAAGDAASSAPTPAPGAGQQ